MKLSAKIRIKICVGERRRRLAKIVVRPQVRLMGEENDGSCNFVYCESEGESKKSWGNLWRKVETETTMNRERVIFFIDSINVTA